MFVKCNIMWFAEPDAAQKELNKLLDREPQELEWLPSCFDIEAVVVTNKSKDDTMEIQIGSERFITDIPWEKSIKMIEKYSGKKVVGWKDLEC